MTTKLANVLGIANQRSCRPCWFLAGRSSDCGWPALLERSSVLRLVCCDLRLAILQEGLFGLGRLAAQTLLVCSLDGY